MVFLHLVIGEMVPKNLAMAAPEKTALWFSPGLVAFARLCGPVTTALGACAKLVLRLFKVEPKDEVEAVYTSAQLGRLLKDSRQAGLLEPVEQERLEDALELGSRPVTDVLLARDRIVTVDPSVTPRQIERLTVRTGYSRFPVCSASGAFMGYLHVKDVLDLEDRERAVPQRVWRRMTTLSATLPLDDALSVMRRDATHLAQVADASGRVLGLVAMEDVLEMLVGEVRDPAHRTPPQAHAARAPLGGRPDGLTPSPDPPYGGSGGRRAHSGGSGRSWGPRPDRTSPYACIRSGSRSVARSSREGSPAKPASRRSR